MKKFDALAILFGQNTPRAQQKKKVIPRKLRFKLKQQGLRLRKQWNRWNTKESQQSIQKYTSRTDDFVGVKNGKKIATVYAKIKNTHLERAILQGQNW